MAVRIALQCSEVDSLLILAENNLAAKWLSRPGEAIYNDANGAPEGNHFFQVVWLSDEKREAYLEQTPRPGPASGSPSWRARRSSSRATRRPSWRRTPCSPRSSTPRPGPRRPARRQAWLGDAVAIKDPTSALFRRQGGNHLLIVGQNDEAALGVIGRGAPQPGRPVRPPAADGQRVGAPGSSCSTARPRTIPRPASSASSPRVLPHGVKVGGWRDAAEFLAAAAGEVALPAAARRRRRPRALPLHPRPGAVPRPPPPRGRFRLQPHGRGGRRRPIIST